MADTNFPFFSTLEKPEIQTLGGLVIESFVLGHVFGKLEPFFQFFIMADTNFLFPFTLEKLETQTLGKSVIGSFPLNTILGN